MGRPVGNARHHFLQVIAIDGNHRHNSDIAPDTLAGQVPRDEARLNPRAVSLTAISLPKSSNSVCINSVVGALYTKMNFGSLAFGSATKPTTPPPKNLQRCWQPAFPAHLFEIQRHGVHRECRARTLCSLRLCVESLLLHKLASNNLMTLFPVRTSNSRV